MLCHGRGLVKQLAHLVQQAQLLPTATVGSMCLWMVARSTMLLPLPLLLAAFTFFFFFFL